MPTNAYIFTNEWLAHADEEELATWGLFPGDDALSVSEIWNTDVYTMENTIISSIACIDDVKEAASTLVATLATLLAVALLI
jgi:hypothetical protein